MRIIYLLFFSALPTLFWAQKISPIINMQQKSLIDCFLLLEQQAEFPNLPKKDKLVKGRYVFAQLQKAQAAQAPILAQLNLCIGTFVVDRVCAEGMRRIYIY